jgi:hypothetical protein
VAQKGKRRVSGKVLVKNTLREREYLENVGVKGNNINRIFKKSV